MSEEEKFIELLEYLKKPYSEIMEETPEISDYEQMKRSYENMKKEIEDEKAREIEYEKERENIRIMWGLIFFMEYVIDKIRENKN